MSKDLQLRAKNAVDAAEAKIVELEQQGRLKTPPDYSASNALRSAYLELQQTKNKEKQPVLKACTPQSITNALLTMVVSGLTTAKDQGYFISYGSKLSFQRSYFGDISLAKRLAGVKEVNAQVVYRDDDFEYEISPDGRKIITKHKQELEAADSHDFKAAYCVVKFDDGREPKTDVMTRKQVIQAWKQGGYKEEAKYKQTQDKFTEEMVKKVVIKRALKPLIKATSDNYLLTDSFEVAEEVTEDAIEDETASEVFDIEPEEDDGVAADFEEEDVPEEEPSPKPPREKGDAPWDD